VFYRDEKSTLFVAVVVVVVVVVDGWLVFFSST